MERLPIFNNEWKRAGLAQRDVYESRRHQAQDDMIGKNDFIFYWQYKCYSFLRINASSSSGTIHSPCWDKQLKLLHGLFPCKPNYCLVKENISSHCPLSDRITITTSTENSSYSSWVKLENNWLRSPTIKGGMPLFVLYMMISTDYLGKALNKQRR